MNTADGIRYKELQKASLITIAVNAALTLAKLIIGILSGSTAVVSDAVHTFSDVFTTVMVMAGLKMSNEKADDEHPYGHFRIESLVSLFLAVVLAATAIYLGYTGTRKLGSGEAPEPSVGALLITAFSIASKEWMFQYTKRKAKKYNSSSLMSDAWHHRSDALSSVAVLIGVIGVFFGAWFLDSIAALAVCLVLLKVSFDIGKTAVYQLIDHSADEETRDKIRQIAMSVSGVRAIDLLRTRISNNVIFVELEISVDSYATVKEGHNVAEEVHDILETSGMCIEHCMVHVNPGNNAS